MYGKVLKLFSNALHQDSLLVWSLSRLCIECCSVLIGYNFLYGFYHVNTIPALFLFIHNHYNRSTNC